MFGQKQLIDFKTEIYGHHPHLFVIDQGFNSLFMKVNSSCKIKYFWVWMCKWMC